MLSSPEKKSTGDGCWRSFLPSSCSHKEVKACPNTELEGFPFLLFPTCHLFPDTKSFFCVIIITIPRSLLLSLLPQLLQCDQKINQKLCQIRKFRLQIQQQNITTYHSSKSLGLSHTFCQHHNLLLLHGECWQLLANQVFNALKQLYIIPEKRHYLESAQLGFIQPSLPTDTVP